MIKSDQACCSVLAEPLGSADADDLSAAFKALSDPARLRLLSLIASQPTGEVCACELVAPIGKSQPTVSHHLKVLYEAGLVTKEKRGSWIWYRAVPERLEQLRGALEPVPALRR
ncbi:MAG TPA: metalloregulator ArsR/SmtB family transcription factor [Actinomycetota bacterium]|jgi:ArsR family transcriptional regulator|nr:metalloregulator ArsR/SmtB family transcription factor [Actinomycetota bacterium]